MRTTCAVGDLARQQRVGRLVLLHPVDHRGHGIDAIGSDAAAAVRHARHHEQAREVGRALAVLRDDRLVVVHAHHRLKNLVRPPVGHDHLAAALAELRQVSVLRVGQLAPAFDERRVAVVVELHEVVLGLRRVEDQIAHHAFGQVEVRRLGARLRRHDRAHPPAVRRAVRRRRDRLAARHETRR